LAAHRKSIVARWCITLSVSKVLKAIGMEYCVIDRANALVHGPYETLDEACARADALTAWEIINGNGDLIDWSLGPSCKLPKKGVRGAERPGTVRSALPTKASSC